MFADYNWQISTYAIFFVSFTFLFLVSVKEVLINLSSKAMQDHVLNSKHLLTGDCNLQ